MKKPIDKPPEKPFSVFLFAFTITMTLAFFAAVLRLVAPKIANLTFASSLIQWCVVFFATHVFLGFAEFFFHRYVLHAPFWFLKRIYVQHTLHHSLTSVKLIAVRDGTGRIFNRYPILEESQYEASYFPWYSLSVFVGALSPIIVLFQALLPSWPIAAGMVLAIAWSVSLYEIVHMIEHLSFETFWKPKLSHKRFGNYWMKFYCFHLRHHADVMSNENISGFFGIPIADFTFGTYAPWPKAFCHGETLSQGEFQKEPPKPCRLIRFLDSILLIKKAVPS